jgi:hypothetical protein
MPDAEAVAVPVEPPAPQPPKRILPPDPQLQEPEPEPVVVPAAEPPPPVAPVPVPGPLDAPSVDAPSFDALTGPLPAVEAGKGPVARLIFSSGEVVDVDRPVVVGRAPEQGRFGGDEGVRLVTVPSPHHEISSTHVEIRPGEGGDLGSAVVTDLGSTNGTVVVQPGQPADDLQPGIAVRLSPGATIDLGEGVTIQVERGRSDAT